MSAGGWVATLAGIAAGMLPAWAVGGVRVRTAGGVVEGTVDRATGVRAFKGVPFAAPPVGELRWKPPQPAPPWRGVRRTRAFGARPMQNPVFKDMRFRSDGMSEDCLYLNVWAPAEKPGGGPLPVLAYFYGGGFAAGDSSEYRYDGAAMARQGIVMVTVNYRLGVFGFLAHPGLTAESQHASSGNYGLLDQWAALMWVRDNISAFGGDPARITIAGESAGSISVCALMASPLSKPLIAGAIGESGSIMKKRRTLPDAEKAGLEFAATLGRGGSPSVAELRRVPAAGLLEASGKPGVPWFWPIVDGWFLPRPPAEIFEAGEQARVPLLAGSNTEEGSAGWILGDLPPTAENWQSTVRKLYGESADEVLRLYPASTEPEVLEAARDLSSDRFISHETWRWIETATRTGGAPTWYYLFAKPRPGSKEGVSASAETPSARPRSSGVTTSVGTPNDRPRSSGATHASEIEYALGNLALNPEYAWTDDDRAVSRTMQGFLARFAATGDPNGPGLPEWPRYSTGARMILDTEPRAEIESTRARYELLRKIQDSSQGPVPGI